MTAEIAIMNKLAVALAADSAVTVETEAGQKVYNTVNKLFTLSKYEPVGVMIFGSAEIMRVPWEALIKLYRAKLSIRKFPTVKAYASDFIKYLETNRTTFTLPEQRRYFRDTVRQYFHSILRDINQAVQEALGKKTKITAADVARIVNEQVNKHHREWRGTKRLKLPLTQETRIRRRYGKELNKLKRSVFKKLPIARAASEKLSQLAAWLFTKENFRVTSSGIVFAGFGSRETFPNLCSFRVEGLLLNRLKCIKHKEARIHFDNEAAILPFAQSEMVATFIEGVDPFYQRTTEEYLKRLFDQYPNAIEKLLRMSAPAKNKIQKEGRRVLNDFLAALQHYRGSKHVSPVLDAVRVLPKDELAAMAESLVNLTSFKRRVTMDAETVGGPIDVAVISKGDGFVWIKRKHYFTRELNPQFVANYFRDEKD
jgi:hypothetical protein